MLVGIPSTITRAVLTALCLAAAAPGSAQGLPPRTQRSPSDLWVRPSQPDGPLIWGRKDGIVFGLPSPGGLPGPRGLIRVGIVREQVPKTAGPANPANPDLVNFIAFEPVVLGRKGFSELERSRLDGAQGKRLTVSGPVEGVLEAPERKTPREGAQDDMEVLVVAVLCEPFENGARVRAELRISSDRPEELRITLFAAEGSAPIEENTVTATMGNYGRLRKITLKDCWIDSRELFKGYQGDGFADHPPLPLGEIPRLEAGDVLVAAVTDEKDPASVKMAGARFWQYRSIPLTQYWRVEAQDVDPGLRLRVNGRRVYWQTRQEIPGGIAFENFEMRSRFKPGQTFIFALSRRSPADLGVDPERRPLNVLLLTADDLHCESVGAFGGKIPDLTPNLDRLAAEGMRFFRAHVNAAICQPSRGVLATGLYGHNSGIMGFQHTDRNVATIMSALREAGYLTGILGKVGHSTPRADYRWDFARDQSDLGAGRDPQLYYRCCREFLDRCRRERKPFYFMVNAHDPHRPFHVPGKPIPGAVEPSRTYRPEDVPVPGFVPDLPRVREEVSYYLNSVRRCDDSFGRVLEALDEAGYRDETLVMFLSDNGIAIPFAKCNVYPASTRTPWIARWPGVVKAGSIDREHFISGVDFFPTILDALGLPVPGGLDGSSFVPLLRGQPQAGRDRVFTQIDRKAGGDAVPMRCVHDGRYAYIYNSWSDGSHVYRNNNEGMTMRAMEDASAGDPFIASRVRLFRFRVPEELYDLDKDPNCLKNLIDDSGHGQAAERLRSELRAWMERTEDPLLPAFEARGSPEKVRGVLEQVYGR